MKLFKRCLFYLACRHAWFKRLYVRQYSPRGEEYVQLLRAHHVVYSIGDHCQINLDVRMTDPAYVRIGNNVILSDCTLIGHDASAAMLERAYGVKLEAVGKIDIRDNVFIGHGAIILPGVTIGPNAIVAAGSVVNRDVAEGDVVAGVPARPVSRVEKRVSNLRESTVQYPWASLIEGREGGFDPSIEPQLVAARVKYFYET